MPLVNVMVNSRAYTIACDEGEQEHLKELAAHVDSKVRELTGSVGQVGDQKLLLMAAVLITDELYDARGRIDGHAKKAGELATAQAEFDARVADVEKRSSRAIEDAEKRASEAEKQAARAIEDAETRAAQAISDVERRIEDAERRVALATGEVEKKSAEAIEEAQNRAAIEIEEAAERLERIVEKLKAA